MKQSTKIAGIAVIFGAGLWIGSFISSNADGLIQTNKPGSVEDPVVTKSYVDQKVSAQVAAEVAKQTGNQQNVTELINQKVTELQQNLNKQIQAQIEAASTKMVVVTVTQGQTLIADEGTEFIVRNGKAVASSTDGSGIPDVTGGKDLTNGTAIPTNHLLIFPRKGRGIQPDTGNKASVVVMVRGNYSLVNQDGSIVKKP